MDWNDYFWGMHLFWWIYWVAIVTVLLLMAWPGSQLRRQTAVEALQRAFAAGQITEEDYRRRLAVLREGADLVA